MKDQFKKYFDKKTIFLGCILFFVFALLVYFFPYSGDDWAWGSELGISRLQNKFDNYNGRYAGNILVMILTRSNALRIITIAASLLALCFIAKLFCESKHSAGIFISALLILLTPKQIFVQSITWTAGFSNYIPPILIIALYCLSIKNIFLNETPQYSKLLPLFTFAAGFISSLFMENVTLYGLAVSVVVILYSAVKHKKIFAVHIANFIGTLLGTITMFSNSAYLSILNSNDSYRSMASGDNRLTTINTHLQIIVEQFFTKNLILLVIVSVLCALLVFIKIKNNSHHTDSVLSVISIIINIFSLIIIYVKKEFSHWRLFLENKNSEELTSLFILCVALIYIFTVIEIVYLCVEDKSKMLTAEFLLLSIGVLIVPLLVVNPIGPRCFFPPYYIMVMFCVYIFEYIYNIMKPGKTFIFSINTVSATAGAAVLVFLISIYSTIHTYDVKRNEYALAQSNLGYETITVFKLPYTSYVWTGDPSAEPWSTRYKLFHNIDQEKDLVLISFNEFNEWVEKFEKETSQKSNS